MSQFVHEPGLDQTDRLAERPDWFSSPPGASRIRETEGIRRDFLHSARPLQGELFAVDWSNHGVTLSVKHHHPSPVRWKRSSTGFRKTHRRNPRFHDGNSRRDTLSGAIGERPSVAAPAA